MRTLTAAEMGRVLGFATVKQASEEALAAQAAAGQGVPPQMDMRMHRYMSYQPRRDLTELEQAEVDSNKQQIIPKIFKSLGDSPSVDMASPHWTSAGTGVLGGMAGGILGGALGGRGGGAVGVPLGVLLGAIAGYKMRDAKNRTIEEYMRRMPVGGTRRDIQADPAWQAEQDRLAQLQAARIQSK